MSLSRQIKKVTRLLAVSIFTLIEVLGRPRIPGEKTGKDREKV